MEQSRASVVAEYDWLITELGIEKSVLDENKNICTKRLELLKLVKWIEYARRN